VEAAESTNQSNSQETMPHRIAQAGNDGMAILSRGDLAGRLAATLNKWLKRPGCGPVAPGPTAQFESAVPALLLLSPYILGIHCLTDFY